MTLNYLIYFVVFIILVFVIIITFNALKKVSQFRQKKTETSYQENKFKELAGKDEKKKISYEITELKKLHNKGVLTDEEFKRAKDKILE